MAGVSSVLRVWEAGMAFAVPEFGMFRKNGDNSHGESRQTNGRHNGHEKTETSI
jgi:hypothetical protein